MTTTDNDAAITRAVALDIAASLGGVPSPYAIEAAAILRRLVRDNDHLRAELAALREPAGEWRTIESAPTDRSILVCRDGEQAVVFWGVSIEEGDGAWIIARSLGSDPVAFRFRDPSHWTPLPPPPDTAP